MQSSFQFPNSAIALGTLHRVHHIALNVSDLKASRHFYGYILGLHELSGDEVRITIKDLVASGKAASFITPDGMGIDLFWEPDMTSPSRGNHVLTCVDHLAFEIDPQLFDQTVETLRINQVSINPEPVNRPTGKGIYFYDPDGFLLEIRCELTNV